MDNGQPFPSLNTMDKPFANADGSIDVHFGQDSPGTDKNWIRTLPAKVFFVILRLYGPTKAFFDNVWKPGDLHKFGKHRGAITMAFISRLPSLLGLNRCRTSLQVQRPLWVESCLKTGYSHHGSV